MARTDIFNRQTDIFGGSFSSDSGRLTFPNVLGQEGDFAAQVGLLIQNLSISYRQQITRLYEVGTPAVFYVGGRVMGDGNINRVVGPRTLQQAFYKKYGDVCQASTNSMRFSASTGCGPGSVLTQNIGGQPNQVSGGRVAYMSYFVVLVQLSLQLNAEQFVIGESLAYMFGSLDYETENGQGALTNP